LQKWCIHWVYKTKYFYVTLVEVWSNSKCFKSPCLHCYCEMVDYRHCDCVLQPLLAVTERKVSATLFQKIGLRSDSCFYHKNLKQRNKIVCCSHLNRVSFNSFARLL